MSTEEPEISTSYLWFLAGGLSLYCIVLTAITGDIGFNGDDWWVLSFPYWHNFSDSLILYAHKFLRPVEGFYWISLFELFGFNRVAFHLCSLLLLAGAAVLMGVSLDRAFPGRRTWVSMAVLFAFFLPPVSCLTYVLFTDNSRLSMLWFWASVVAFQRWAQKSSPWQGLALPLFLYVGSFLTYEAPSFLIFVAPMLVWPVHRRCCDRSTDRAFIIKLCAGIITGFAAAVACRFVILNGGAVGQSHLLPPLELLWSYLALLPFYLLAPFTSMSADRWALLAGFLVVLGTAGLFFFACRDRTAAETLSEARFEPWSKWYVVVLGVGILLLGMLPYQLAGYGSFSPRLVETLAAKCWLRHHGDLSWYNFTWASRIYSAGSFGVAILLAAGLIGWRKPSIRMAGKAVGLVVIVFLAVFHTGLSQDWREAAEIHNNLMRSLVTQVPAVRSGTNFLFVDVDCSHKRVEVVRRWNCMPELVRMLYADKTLDAWYVYPYACNSPNHVAQRAVATPAGFLSRGQRQGKPAPPESLLLFKRSGRELVLLDRIKDGDGSVPIGIEWQGVRRLASNFDRIEACQTVTSPEARLARNAWTSGLMSTLQLTRLKSTLARLRGPKYLFAHSPRRRHLFKLSPPRIKARL